MCMQVYISKEYAHTYSFEIKICTLLNFSELIIPKLNWPMGHAQIQRLSPETLELKLCDFKLAKVKSAPM